MTQHATDTIARGGVKWGSRYHPTLHIATLAMGTGRRCSPEIQTSPASQACLVSPGIPHRIEHVQGLGYREWCGMTYLQIRARMSPLPVAKTPPVGLGATEMTTKS
jgi:hypothetical protein